MSTTRTGFPPSVEASPRPSHDPSRRGAGYRLRLWCLKTGIRWRTRRDPAAAAFQLLRLDDDTLAALGLRRESIRSDLLHLDLSTSSSFPTSYSKGDGGDAR